MPTEQLPTRMAARRAFEWIGMFEGPAAFRNETSELTSFPDPKMAWELSG